MRSATRTAWQAVSSPARESAQAAIEFLLVTPFLFFFFLLLVDLGIMMYEYVSVSNSVREAARYGAVNCGGTCSVDLVRDRAVDRSGGIVSDPAEVDVGWIDINGDGLNSGRGDAIVVRVNHNYAGVFFPFNINVYSCADMRLEQRDRGTGLPSGTGC